MARSLALIHAGLSHGGMWAPLLEALALDVDPVRIELPGHGDAEEWDRSRDFSDHALELALAAMPSEPVPLVGLSYGAVLALRLAVERPARVSSLVLIEPVFYAAVRGTEGHDTLKRLMAPIAKKTKEGQHYAAARLFLEQWGDGTPWAQLPQRVKTYAVDRIEHVMAADTLIWDDLSGVLQPGRIEGLDLPVTLVEGGASHPIIARIVDALGERMRDAEGITVPEAGHMVPVTHPKAVAVAIKDRLVWPD